MFIHEKFYEGSSDWLTNFDKFIVHEDGSFTCKASKEVLQLAETRSLVVALLWESSFDFQIAGEDGCAGNFDMYSQLYNTKNGLLYLILYSDSEKFARGEEVTIYGREVTDEEHEEIIAWWIGGGK